VARIAGAADVADFTASCTRSTNLGKATCACAANKAEAELSNKGFDLLVAMFNADESTSRRLRSEISMQENTKVAAFMMQAPSACRRGQVQTPTGGE